LVLNAEPTLQNTASQHIRIETFGAEDIAKPQELEKELNEFKPSAEQLSAQHLGYVERPAYRPVTKFENRGIKLGHGVWDLVYTKK